MIFLPPARMEPSFFCMVIVTGSGPMLAPRLILSHARTHQRQGRYWMCCCCAQEEGSFLEKATILLRPATVAMCRGSHFIISQCSKDFHASLSYSQADVFCRIILAWYPGISTVFSRLLTRNVSIYLQDLIEGTPFEPWRSLFPSYFSFWLRLRE